jgi:hypothetical protein
MKYQREGLMARRRREKRERREAEAKAMKGAPENKMQPAPDNKADDEAIESEVWPMAMKPEAYIALNADSDNPTVQAKVELARRIVGA